MTYRPYREYRVLSMFFIMFAILFVVFAGVIIFANVWAGLIFLFSGVFFLLVAKWLYDISGIVIILEQQGLHIVDRKHKDGQYYSWETLSCAYYIRNFKNFLFLILSPKKLSCEEASFFMKRCENSSRVCIDNVVVFRVDLSRDMPQLIDFVNDRVLYIDDRDQIRLIK